MRSSLCPLVNSFNTAFFHLSAVWELIKFLDLESSVYLRWVLIRSWKHFQQVVILFCNKTINTRHHAPLVRFNRIGRENNRINNRNNGPSPENNRGG